MVPTLEIIWRPRGRLLDDLVSGPTPDTGHDRLAVRPMVACDSGIGHRTVTLRQLGNDLVEGIDPGGFAIGRHR